MDSLHHRAQVIAQKTSKLKKKQEKKIEAIKRRAREKIEEAEEVEQEFERQEALNLEAIRKMEEIVQEKVQGEAEESQDADSDKMKENDDELFQEDDEELFGDELLDEDDDDDDEEVFTQAVETRADDKKVDDYDLVQKSDVAREERGHRDKPRKKDGPVMLAQAESETAAPRGSFGSILNILTFGIFGRQEQRLN